MLGYYCLMNKLNFLSNFLKVRTAYAHCDIPCGVYDVQNLQMAAHTIVRMTQLFSQIKRDDETRVEHDVSRVTSIKEKHGGIIEEELGTLDHDYFKPEHHESFPELRELITDTIKLSVITRQKIDPESGDKLLENTLKISEIFYKTKNLTPVRVPSGYPTGGEIVMHS